MSEADVKMIKQLQDRNRGWNKQEYQEGCCVEASRAERGYKKIN